jgi:hypothetical protein
VTEIMPRTENEQAVTEEDGEREDEAERESTQICLYLGKSWHPDMSADVYRDSAENWISEKLLRQSNDVIESSRCAVAYRAPDGIRLESKGCVKVDYRLSLDGKTFPGVLFQVHASRSCEPAIILGKSWAQKHGAVAAELLSRRSGNSKDRNTRPKHTRSHAFTGSRIMKLPHRQKLDRDAGKSKVVTW